jgi:hypothetical protein
MNLTGEDDYYANQIADELIPAEYKKLQLPAYLNDIRTVIFGANPDRAMLNYRCAQLLTLISATQLQEYVTALDPRLTYSSYPLQLASDSTFSPTVSQYGNVDNSKVLTVIGGASSPDASGSCEYDYDITIVAGNLIIHNLKAATTTSTAISLTDNLSQPISLSGLEYSVRVNTAAFAGGGWRISGFLRPTVSLSSLEGELQSLSEPVMLQLFGVTDIEPYITFKNCWTYHPDFAYRLGGVVLAAAYRTDELRGGSA